MLDFSRSRTPKQPPGSPLAPDLVLRVGFAGKRQLDEAQTETITTRLRDVFGVIGWRLVEISPMDDATNERPVPAIAKFYSHHPAYGFDSVPPSMRGGFAVLRRRYRVRGIGRVPVLLTNLL